MTDQTDSIKARFSDLDVSDEGGSATYINGISGAVAAPPFLSQVTASGDTIYVSGQIAIDPSTNKMIDPGVEAETELVFDNIEAILNGVGLKLADTVKVSVFLTNFEELPKFNEIYLRRMGGCRPAREALEVSGLALGATVEVTVTAFRKGGLGKECEK